MKARRDGNFMILCDLGNTHANFCEDGRIRNMSVANFESYEPKERVFFVNVNDALAPKLASNPLFVDFSSFSRGKSTLQSYSHKIKC